MFPIPTFRQTDDTAGLRKSLDRLTKSHSDLLKRMEQLSSLLDNLPGMAFRCLYDRELTFVFASRGVKEVLGYEPEEVTGGYAFRQLVHKDDQPVNKRIIAGLTPQNNRYMMTYRMRAAWGEDRWVREQGAAIFTGDGKLVAIEGLLTDITDQKTKELKLQAENLRLRASMNERYRLGPLIGKSAAMQKIYNRILKAAESTASVIVTGESGTGKELAARAIHDLSDRRSGPFVTVNCGAIAENLVESEFFGHLKGAFSGAYTHKDGFLVAAEGGTLFLDEIGEMPLAFQVKLLRALDGKGFSPVGDNKIRTADFRLISATNRDPGHMVHAGLMREDFYYRVNTIPILMPPLRERKDDLPLLIDHFVAMYHEETGRLAEVPPEILPKLAQHDWPGNIRELQNVIRRYLTLKEIHFSPHGQRSSEPGGLATSLSATGTVGPELERTEREIILRALGDNHWHMGRSATALGISRRTLQRRVNKYGLRLASYRPDVAD